jgi:hypothetical protein
MYFYHRVYLYVLYGKTMGKDIPVTGRGGP